MNLSTYRGMLHFQRTVLVRLLHSARTSTTSSQTVPELWKPKILFVLGGPGSGKGTLCRMLAEKHKYIHLSAGDLLRQEQNSGSKDGKMINECIQNGKIVAPQVTVRLLERAIHNARGGGAICEMRHATCGVEGAARFLIDGFPRNLSNLQRWMEHMDKKVDVEGVLFLNCPEDVSVMRILERGKSSERVDDNEDSLRKRFQTYYAETLPVIEYFENLKLVRKVEAGTDAMRVFEMVEAQLGLCDLSEVGFLTGL